MGYYQDEDGYYYVGQIYDYELVNKVAWKQKLFQ